MQESRLRSQAERSSPCETTAGTEARGFGNGRRSLVAHRPADEGGGHAEPDAERGYRPHDWRRRGSVAVFRLAAVFNGTPGADGGGVV